MLNATEGTITFVLIAAAIFLLFSSGTLNTGAADQKVLTVQNDYLTVQILRSFSQTPITIDDETMTVAQALNEYYSLDLLDSKDFTAEERRIHATRKQELYDALTQLSKGSLAPLIDSGHALYANIYFQNKLINYKTLILCNGEASRADGLQSATKKEILQLPANLNLKDEQTADYYIELSIWKWAK